MLRQRLEVCLSLKWQAVIRDGDALEFLLMLEQLPSVASALEQAHRVLQRFGRARKTTNLSRQTSKVGCRYTVRFGVLPIDEQQ